MDGQIKKITILPRRAFLMGFGGAGLGLWPKIGVAEEDLSNTPGGMAMTRSMRQPQPVRFTARNTNTNETINMVYRVGNQYSQIASQHIAYFMRDWRINQARYMDQKLTDIIAYIHFASGSVEPIMVNSGYRSPQTNSMLARNNPDVATNSLHMYGQACDIWIPDITTRWIRDAGLVLGMGGVGFYPRSNFVHLDTGVIRRWGA